MKPEDYVNYFANDDYDVIYGGLYKNKVLLSVSSKTFCYSGYPTFILCEVDNPDKAEYVSDVELEFTNAFNAYRRKQGK